MLPLALRGRFPMSKEEPLLNENGELRQGMAMIDGKSFRCEDCGCNVFHHPDKNDLTKYRCNGCNARYIGE